MIVLESTSAPWRQRPTDCLLVSFELLCRLPRAKADEHVLVCAANLNEEQKRAQLLELAKKNPHAVHGNLRNVSCPRCKEVQTLLPKLTRSKGHVLHVNNGAKNHNLPQSTSSLQRLVTSPKVPKSGMCE